MIIRFDEEMFAESPLAPGTAGRNTDLCVGALFNPFNGCSAGGTAASLSTLHHGTPTGNKLFDGIASPHARGKWGDFADRRLFEYRRDPGAGCVGFGWFGPFVAATTLGNAAAASSLRADAAEPVPLREQVKSFPSAEQLGSVQPLSIRWCSPAAQSVWWLWFP